MTCINNSHKERDNDFAKEHFSLGIFEDGVRVETKQIKSTYHVRKSQKETNQFIIKYFSLKSHILIL